MRSRKLPITALLLCIFVLSVSNLFAQAEHFQRVGLSNIDMSVLVRTATLDDEDLVADNEIGIFTYDHVCVGAEIVERAGAQLGVPCMGDEDLDDEEKTGFYEEEEMFFRVWDHDAEEEWRVDTEDIDIIDNDEAELVFLAGTWLRVDIAAYRTVEDPDIEVSPTDLSFGNVWDDGEDDSGDTTFVIRSVGTGVLVVQPIEVDGDMFSTDFGDEPVSIDPDAEQDTLVVTVTFTPPETGEFNGTLTISHNVENREAIEVTLWGELREPSPRIRLSAREHDFGSVPIQNSSRNWQLFIYNDGEEDLVIDGANVGDDQFSTDYDGEITIEAEDSHLMEITFDPAEVGRFETDLELSSNATNADSICHLMGGGIDDDVPPIIDFPEQDMDGDPPRAQHFFGVVDAEDTEHWRMTILNSGGRDLWIYDIVSTNEVFATEWNADSVRLRPDDHYYVDVSFTPDSEANFYGVLEISSNDPNVDTTFVNDTTYYTDAVVFFRGDGTEDEMWEGRHFRYLQTNVMVSHIFGVREATFDNDTLVPGDEIGVFTPSGFCAGAVVVPEEGNLGFTAWPDAFSDDRIINGFREDEELTYKIWHAESETEAWAEPDYEEGPEVFTPNGMTRLSLAAGIPEPDPEIELSAELYHFGQVDYDDHEIKDWEYLTIYNRGEGLLEVYSIDSDMGQFTVDFEGADIEGGFETEVTVTFAPDAEGFFEGRLTIQSNDPLNNVLYVDVDGYGVDTVRVPDIELPAEGHFFGVQHVNEGPWEGGPYEWTLGIENVASGGILNITDVILQGNDAFDTDWDDRDVEVQPEGVFDLGITFNPSAGGRFNAVITIVSDSPEEEEIQFLLQGYGSGADDYFLHFETETSHTINLDRVFLWMDTENDNNGFDEDDWTADLVAGDEVAVFDGDLCVGHLTIDGDESFSAFASDPDNVFDDGFIADHEMTFRFWDWTAGEDLVCDAPIFNGGDEAFAPNGGSNVDISAEIMSRERQIAYDILPDNGEDEDPDHWEWGPVAVDESVDHTILIINSGDHELTVTDIEVTDQLETDFDGEVVVGAGRSFELVVTFTPDEPRAFNDAPNEVPSRITVISDDPDEPEFAITMTGMGSDAQNHFEWYNPNISHGIFVELFTMGGAAPGIGDEIAVFVPEGFFPGIPAFCAGSDVVVDADEGVSVAAFGDDPNSRELLEGFRNNEVITFKVWDASQETLYEGEAVDVDVQQGRLNWASQSMTLVHIDVPGVFSLVSDPTSVHVVEGDLAELQLVPNNPPVDDMIFAIVDRDGVGGELDDEGHFEWQTSPGDAGDYYPVFSLTDPNDEDVMDSVTVWIEVIDRNFPPVYGDPPGEGWIFEENVWWYHIPEDNGDNPDAWFTIIADLNQFCTDVDEDRLTFFTRPSDPENRVLCEIVAQESVRVRVDLENEVNDNANWYGNVLCTIVAEDGVDEERDHYSRTLRMIGNISHDANERTLRSTGNRTPSSGPRRDVSTDFEFFLVVDPINDLPEAEAEADAHNEGVWRFYEGVEDSYLVLATDVEDDPNELRWSVVDEQIPEGAEFIDNEDSTGTFTWEPGFDAAGDYTAIFQVVDTDEDTTEITVNIVVDDVNQVPGLTGELPDLVFDEDTGPHVLVEDLFPLFEDLDNDEIRFTVSCDVEELGVEYVDGAINATPVPHWNGEADVVVTVQDFLNDVPRGDPVDYPFHVTITSINDAPGGEDGFILVTPADNDPFTDEMETLNFSWTEAVQVPFEGDDVVTYVFVARIADSPEDTIAIPDLDAIEYNDVNVREVVAQLGIEEEDFQIHVVVEWNVYAVDTEGAFAEASNSWFRIDVNLAVDDPEASLIPEDYYLSPNFPNPFNARTTVRFGLPTAGDVQVMVWDMHGRQVANLASGYHAAGRFEVVWDAGQIPTGVYVIRLTSGDARIMQKAILLK